MTSETDDSAHHIHVDSRRGSSAEEPLIDGGGASSGKGPRHNGGGDGTHARRGDDTAVEPTCRRHAQNEFLYAMKEDLGEWLGTLYGVDIGADEFFEKLETGVLLCRHANAVHDRLSHSTKDSTRTNYSAHSTDDSSKLYYTF